MAELEVQPKKSNPWLWLLLAVVAIGLIFFLMRSCNNKDAVMNSGDSTTVASADNTMTADNEDWWNTVDFDAPDAKYDEITDKGISVRGNDEYAVYSLDETVLFDSGQSAIRTDAAARLRQIVASAAKRFNGGAIRVYGHTDATGSAGENMKLAEDRAEAVKNWLVKDGKISEGMVSVHPVGEARPAASNATDAGREQNRRVEIVIRRKNG